MKLVKYLKACRAIFFLVILFFEVNVSVAQKPGFVLQTDRSEISAGETFVLEVILQNMDEKNIKLPDLSPFKILQGPSTSTSISIINGRRSSTYSFQYLLLAAQKGNYSLGPATLQVGSKVLRSNTVSILVKEADKSVAVGGQAGNKATFLRLELSDEVCYSGQQVILNYVLYTSQNIESYNIINTPDFNGFFAQPITDIRDQPQRKIINGKEYYVQTIQRVALFPQKTGKYTFGPVTCSLEIPVDNGNSSFFFRDTRKEQITTNEVHIDVRALPAGAPTSYSGAVGQFTMRADINKKTFSTGETIVLKMEVEGDGDQRVIFAPEFAIPKDLEKYDPSIIRDETFSKGDRIHVLKEFEFTFVPLKDTVYTIEPVFSYLSSITGKYETLTAGPFEVHVIKGSGKPIQTDSTDSPETLSAISEDDTLVDMKGGLFGSGLYYLLIAGSVAGCLIALYLKRKKRRSLYDSEIAAARPVSEATARLKRSRELLEIKDMPGFYEAVSESVLGYIKKKYQISNMDASLDSIQALLHGRGVSDDLVEKYSHIHKKCELAKFAGQYGQANVIYEEAIELIDALEKI